MPRLDLSSRHVLKVDTRLIVSRRWDFENLASVLAFPGDPSEYTADSVWVEDVAAKQRRQPAVGRTAQGLGEHAEPMHVAPQGFDSLFFHALIVQYSEQ